MESTAQICLRLSVGQRDLLNFLDAKMPDTLYKGILEDQDVFIEIRKLGTPSFRLDDKILEATLPLEITASKDLGFMRPTANGALFLTLETVFDVQNDWTWSTKTSIKEVQWEKKPSINVMGMKISVASMIDKFLSNSESEITDQIDRLIQENQWLRENVKTSLPIFERSYPVESQNNMFVQLIPEKLGFEPFANDENRIITGLRLDGKAWIFPDSQQTIAPIDTPFFYWTQRKDQPEDVSVNVSIAEEEIQKMARDHIIGEDFEFRGKKVRIPQVYFTLQDELIKAEIHLSGDLSGRVYFEGQPRWKDDVNRLEFCKVHLDFHFDKGAPNWLLWFFKSSLKRKVVRQLESTINEEMTARVRVLNDRLHDLKLSEHIRLKGSIYDYSLHPIKIEDKKIKTGAHLNVRGSVFIDALELRIE